MRCVQLGFSGTLHQCCLSAVWTVAGTKRDRSAKLLQSGTQKRSQPAVAARLSSSRCGWTPAQGSLSCTSLMLFRSLLCHISSGCDLVPKVSLPDTHTCGALQEKQHLQQQLAESQQHTSSLQAELGVCRHEPLGHCAGLLLRAPRIPTASHVGDAFVIMPKPMHRAPQHLIGLHVCASASSICGTWPERRSASILQAAG